MGQPVVHWELWSKDPGKCGEFYAKVFDWKVNHIPEMDYRLVLKSMNQAREPLTPATIFYRHVFRFILQYPIQERGNLARFRRS